MPVEIKELVIRTVVAPEASPARGEERAADAPSVPRAAGGEELVEECVRQVLRVLERKKER
jgi:hypothetical protein